jgi:hypothetical protein
VKKLNFKSYKSINLSNKKYNKESERKSKNIHINTEEKINERNIKLKKLKKCLNIFGISKSF